MTLLTAADVETYTQGRLVDDDRTEMLLNAALAAARRYCGWHVTPSRSDTLTVDGSGGAVLLLPTMRLTDITAVTENGVDLDVDTINFAPRGVVWKTSNLNRRWCRDSITFEVVHGFDDVPDFNMAVLTAVERGSFGAAREVIGPFQYTTTGAVNSTFSEAEKAVLDLYRLEPVS